MKYVHTNIISHDWQKLAAFYVEVFNCKIVPPIRKQSGSWLDKGTGVRNAKFTGAHLLLPGHGSNGPTLEIYQYEQIIDQDPVLPNQRGLGHLAFEVDDVKVVLEKILTHGGSKSGEISSRNIEGLGTITFIYARDPDGNLIELQNWS